MRVLDGDEERSSRDRNAAHDSQVRVRCTYVRDGKTVLEQTEFVDRSLTLDELIRLARRFEDLDIRLADIHVGVGPVRR